MTDLIVMPNIAVVPCYLRKHNMDHIASVHLKYQGCGCPKAPAGEVSSYLRFSQSDEISDFVCMCGFQ